MTNIKSEERLIFALDVASADQALALVDELDGIVHFYKVGWRVFMSGGLDELLSRLRDKQVFLDLKVPGDIDETIRSAVEVCVEKNVRFLTLSAYSTPANIRAAVKGRGSSPRPELLFVPFLSSQDRGDFSAAFGRDESEFESFVEERARMAIDSGCDGLIASGQEIGRLRRMFPRPRAIIVSPGIRPAGSSTDDHKRLTTPAEAIRLGSDYLVVGRPIRDAGGRDDRRRVARGIIDEVASALSSD